jgi:hypothetical protein
MKRILVPLDGTKNAEAALDVLGDLCNPDDEVVLLKVEKPESPQRAGYGPSSVITQAISGPAGGVANVSLPDVPVYAETGSQTLQRQIDEVRDYLDGLADVFLCG